MADAARLAMRSLLVIVALVALAGCTAEGQDPFAYMRKPLYTGWFDLAPLAEGSTDGQEFRVEDGSIAQIRLQVWVNATHGGGRVQVYDPSGDLVIDTTQPTLQTSGLELGVWRVVVSGAPAEDGAIVGSASLLVTRA